MTPIGDVITPADNDRVVDIAIAVSQAVPAKSLEASQVPVSYAGLLVMR